MFLNTIIRSISWVGPNIERSMFKEFFPLLSFGDAEACESRVNERPSNTSNRFAGSSCSKLPQTFGRIERRTDVATLLESIE